MIGAFTLPNEYWSNLQITSQDVENLHTILFERETPLTARDLVSEFIESRIQQERRAAEQKQESAGKPYLPKEKYSVGDDLVFPALGWQKGKVSAVRDGKNPTVVDGFDVITVEFEDQVKRLFAAGLASHLLNDEPLQKPGEDEMSADSILAEHGAKLQKKLESAFVADEGLVRIAGRWFPRSLLIDISEGQLNLVEAVLDMAGGEPLPASELIKDTEIPVGANPKLAEFSLNYAMQSDERFDEVGPAGQVLWCLKRLEPDYVREVPPWLRYADIPHDRDDLTPEMLDLEAQLDDELTTDNFDDDEEVSSVTITLIYPHLRAGTLPVSKRTRKLFPTAYEAPRVRFTLVDGKTEQRIPAWVVLEQGYVFGLREWYKAHQLIPGSLVEVRRGKNPDEVIVEAKTQRSSKDWVRTVMVGSDGGFVFAMLKQPITAEFNDRMVVHVPDFKALDPVWDKKRSFEDLLLMVMRELSKSNPQGHVHAQELYAAVNLVRRVPPAPIFAALESNPKFKHVGDLHFRLENDEEGAK